jgi:hypothetical protein
MTELPKLEEIVEVPDDDLPVGITNFGVEGPLPHREDDRAKPKDTSSHLHGAKSAQQMYEEDKTEFLKSIWEDLSDRLMTGEFGKFSTDDRFKYPEYDPLKPDYLPLDTLKVAIKDFTKKVLAGESPTHPNPAIQRAFSRAESKYKEFLQRRDREKFTTVPAQFQHTPYSAPDRPLSDIPKIKEPPVQRIDALEKDAERIGKAEREAEYFDARQDAAEREANLAGGSAVAGPDTEELRQTGHRPGWTLMIMQKFDQKKGKFTGHYVELYEPPTGPYAHAKKAPEIGDAPVIGKGKRINKETGKEEDYDKYEPTVVKKWKYHTIEPSTQKSLEYNDIINRGGKSLRLGFRYSKNQNFWVFTYNNGDSIAMELLPNGFFEHFDSGSAEKCQISAEKRSGVENDEAKELDVRTGELSKELPIGGREEGDVSHFEPAENDFDPKVGYEEEDIFAGKQFDDIDWEAANSHKEDEWGNPVFSDFWISKTPEEIKALNFDPRLLNREVLNDPRFQKANEWGTEEENKAKRAALALSLAPLRGRFKSPTVQRDSTFVPHAGMTGLKTAEFPHQTVSGKTVMRKEKVPDTSLPTEFFDEKGEPIPNLGETEAEWAKHLRSQIHVPVSRIRDFIRKYQKYATVDKKDPAGRTSIAVAFDPKTGEEVRHNVKYKRNEDVDDRELCANCKHTALDHLTSDRTSYLSCQNDECVSSKELSDGSTRKTSKCSHFVPAGKLERRARMRTPLSPSTVLQSLDDMALLHTTTGQTSMRELPYTNGQIQKAYDLIKFQQQYIKDLKKKIEKASGRKKRDLEAQLKSAEADLDQAKVKPRLMELDNEQFLENVDQEELASEDIDFSSPYTKEELLKMQQMAREGNPGPLQAAKKKMFTRSHKLKKTAEEAKSISQQMFALRTYIKRHILPHVRTSKQDDAYETIIKELEGILFKGVKQSDKLNPKVQREFRRAVDDILFGERTGPAVDDVSQGTGEIAIDPNTGKEYPMLPGDKLPKGWEMKEAPGHFGGKKPTTAAPTLSITRKAKDLQDKLENGLIKKGSDKEYYAKAYIRLSSLSPGMRGKVRKVFDKIRSSGNVDDELMSVEADLDALGNIASTLRRSGGRGKQADETMFDRRGNRVFGKGAQMPKVKKQGAIPVHPDLQDKEMQADLEKLAKEKEEKSAAQAAREAEVAAAQAAAEAERAGRRKDFKGTPAARPEAPTPPVERAVLHPDRPVHPQHKAKVERSLEDLLAQLRGTDKKLEEALKMSYGDREPSWLDDL